LAKGPSSVGDLARHFPVSRPAVSQHLRVLKNAGLVFECQVGNRHFYEIDPGGLNAIRNYLDQFWNQALAAYQKAAEQTDEED
jgi:DNA-binding transcriptional ArsR family regulator